MNEQDLTAEQALKIAAEKERGWIEDRSKAGSLYEAYSLGFQRGVDAETKRILDSLARPVRFERV